MQNAVEIGSLSGKEGSMCARKMCCSDAVTDVWRTKRNKSYTLRRTYILTLQ